MELGKKIKQLRFKAGLTQEQLAEKLGIGPQSVSKWENAVAMPDISTLPLLAEIFGVTIDDLFDLTVEQRLNRIENSLDIESELSQDVFREYEDFLKSRRLPLWTPDDERFQPLQAFTKSHNLLADYEPYFQRWNAEEMANVGLTLCYQVDTMMNKYMEGLERTFVTEGGIKERMHQARTGYRRQQEERLAELESLLPQLEHQLLEAQADATHWKAAYEDLKERALKAYYKQQEEIKALKKRLQE